MRTNVRKSRTLIFGNIWAQNEKYFLKRAFGASLQQQNILLQHVN